MPDRPAVLMNAVRDAFGLVSALGHRAVAAVVGHDFGASVAAWCALVRPDVFRSVALMSAPFAGPPELPFATDGLPSEGADKSSSETDIHAPWQGSPARASITNGILDPRRQCRHARLSAGHPCLPARLFPLQEHGLAGQQTLSAKAWTAEELAKMPTYYIMDLDKGMAETVAAKMPSPAQIAACAWLPERGLAVYSGEYARTGFQGGLNWYRSRTSGRFNAELELFSDRTIDVPSLFVSGKSDWGIHQRPGAFERMRVACTRMAGCHLLDGAEHWVQQEQPDRAAELLIGFLRRQD